ncbi:MAG: formate acetyltransferase [Nitrospirae bacterium]|nr:formate acetyltransferase [Nitrospirota bacterium]
MSAARPVVGVNLTQRVRRLHEEVRGSSPALCGERAFLVTRYFRTLADPKDPVILQKAGALEYILGHKAIHIYPQELLVGNFTSFRVGGQLFPELHGVAMMEDLFRFPKRKVNPLQISRAARRRLLTEVLPYWISRIMMTKAHPFPRSLPFLAEMGDPTSYLINEVAGISHFVPDYAGLVNRGTAGYREEAEKRRAAAGIGPREEYFWRAVVGVCDALDGFAERYRSAAFAQAQHESNPTRRAEINGIAEICRKVPRGPATTFHEALQSILFAQIALNLESLDNSVCPGRLDQILHPFYEADLKAGRLDREGAFELLGCFAVKLCEIVPAFSRRGTRFHGGMFNGQVVVVGGTDREGGDATNEVTFLFLELMDALRTRQPNYHARIHAGSPAAYRSRIASALAGGAVSPAVYNDEVIVPILKSRGVAVEDARDYANVGCVEPVAAGRSFFSTDAALFNLPLCMELALNGGRRFGRLRRMGARTQDAANCPSMQALLGLLETQIRAGVARLLADLEAVERANARLHPTPLTSMLLDGCMAKGKDSTEGGAAYNGSGIQGVGAVEVGDCLAAIDWIVFQKKKATLGQVIRACRKNFIGYEELRARLRNAPKYGNDDPLPDGYVGRVMEMFDSTLRDRVNTRGGEYVAGFYSVTSHVAFGRKVGALPSGRCTGDPFSSGLSAGNGRDRRGPTALLRSQAALPLHVARNGINFNLQLDPWSVEGDSGSRRLGALIDGCFKSGGMQMQVNVLDPKVLMEARDHPDRFPGLLVRVSGYSAYFDDLAPEIQQEIIDRMVHGRRQGEPEGITAS